jgi:hypothetical protein
MIIRRIASKQRWLGSVDIRKVCQSILQTPPEAAERIS